MVCNGIYPNVWLDGWFFDEWFLDEWFLVVLNIFSFQLLAGMANFADFSSFDSVNQSHPSGFFAG